SAGPAPAVAEPRDLDLPGDGVRLRATRWPGSSPAVLLLHGLASTRHVWDLVVPHLRGGPGAAPAVVALDQRGHGDSERPEGPYDGAAVVRDALTALDALGLDRVVVVGHSWGATTALRLAADAPSRVLACVAVDGATGLPGGEDRAARRARLTPPRLALSPDELEARLSAGPLGPWWSPEVAAAVRSLFAVGDDGLARARLPFDAHMAVLDDLLDTDHEDLWSRVRCPAWLVGCLPAGPPDDWAAAKHRALDRAAELLALPRVLRWTGAVHDVPLQWPALVAGAVRTARDELPHVWPAPGREGVAP
ncbi:MAG TPA: alpha/beta hydrolase, partial [Mycobacteriales bacterium]|nr:alpha/beta hydrolase [Mycobacteriales bacterium]